MQLEKAVSNFKTYFKQALIEIRDLRNDLGEADWTNRELKIAVKDKSHQNKELIEKIEKFEEIMDLARRRKEKREKIKKDSMKKAKKKLSVEEQLTVDMEKLKHLTMLSDEEDLDKVEYLELDETSLQSNSDKSSSRESQNKPGPIIRKSDSLLKKSKNTGAAAKSVHFFDE